MDDKEWLIEACQRSFGDPVGPCSFERVGSVFRFSAKAKRCTMSVEISVAEYERRVVAGEDPDGVFFSMVRARLERG